MSTQGFGCGKWETINNTEKS